MSAHKTRLALVTGTTSGIGEAIARKFIAEGINVIGNGRNATKLAELETELGVSFCSVSGDASETGVLERMFALAHECFGMDPDIVVANAGRGLGGAVTNADLSQFDEVLKINVAGALALLQMAANRMVEKQKSAFPRAAADIVIIGSVVGRNVSPFSAVYGASKFALHGLAEGLRREVGPKGVRVSLVEPGIVVSGFQEVAGYSDETVRGFDEKFGPLLVGSDVANAIHFLVSQPPHVHISDIVVRPTRQDYP